MEIHYFAAARAAAGIPVEHIDTAAGATVGEILAARAAAHDGRTQAGMSFGDVLARCTFLLDGARVESDATVDGAHRLDVLPPFAGG
ncbi:MoaD/ThiS family protein [Corynebacterium uterequi]|uniref:ThiS family protein n=1 Tax=Corynebacterium uterequi TaxID=1072256 RepID=A0A0G3HA09_9CORY|nr:MoaD/ThiS family protein [Corynebacterium uterequi]AKK10134.1 ThiS family protein [Corynebacterium uterequi]